MYLVHTPLLFKKIYHFGPVWQKKTDSKSVYITFDDGPVPEVTPEILEILDQFSVKATFFCVGENIERNPELFKQIRDKGHATGNHTNNHLNGWKTDSKKYFENIRKCDHFHSGNLFRPPYGRIKPSQILKLKKTHQIIMWTVLSGDFDMKTSPKKCLENAIKFTKPGSIVVFHDSIKAKEKVLFALPAYIENLIEKGFEFKTL